MKRVLTDIGKFLISCRLSDLLISQLRREPIGGMGNRRFLIGAREIFVPRQSLWKHYRLILKPET